MKVLCVAVLLLSLYNVLLYCLYFALEVSYFFVAIKAKFNYIFITKNQVEGLFHSFLSIFKEAVIVNEEYFLTDRDIEIGYPLVSLILNGVTSIGSLWPRPKLYLSDLSAEFSLNSSYIRKQMHE